MIYSLLPQTQGVGQTGGTPDIGTLWAAFQAFGHAPPAAVLYCPGRLRPQDFREAAQRIARNWWMFLLNGLLLIVSGVLIFSIDWSLRSLATFNPARL